MIFHIILLLMHFVLWSWLSARAGINSIHSGYSILLVSGILLRQIKTSRKTRWKELVYFLFVCKLLHTNGIGPFARQNKVVRVLNVIKLLRTDPVVHRQPETEQQKHFSTISFAVKYSRNRLESRECLNFGPNFFLVHHTLRLFARPNPLKYSLFGSKLPSFLSAEED